MNEEDRATLDDLGTDIARLDGAVRALGGDVKALTAAIERAVKVAIARG